MDVSKRPVLITLLAAVVLLAGFFVVFLGAGTGAGFGSGEVDRTGARAPTRTGTPDASGRAENDRNERSSERVEILEGRESRRLEVVFECASLGRVATDLWNAMGLRVRIHASVDRVALAEFDHPERAHALALPEDVPRLSIRAPGYRPLDLECAALLGDSDAPRVVRLEPDAVVHVRVHGVPVESRRRLTCGARLAAAGLPGGGVLVPPRTAQTGAVRGPLEFEFRIPSGVSAGFFVGATAPTRADRSAFAGIETEVVTLAPDEERTLDLDLSAIPGLRGRVAGVAPQALADQVLVVHMAPGGTRRLLLDAQGGFVVRALGDRQVSLGLRTRSGRAVELRDDAGRSHWRAHGAELLVVQPREPVDAVAPARAGRLVEERFCVQAGTAPVESGLGRSIPLFSRAELSSTPLHFLVEGVGRFEKRLADALPGGDGLHLVEVPAPGGSLVVEVEGQPESGVSLFAQPVDQEGGGVAGTATRQVWSFPGLPAGAYRIAISCDGKFDGDYVHSGRLLAGDVRVLAGQETRTRVRMPQRVRLQGRVTNWAEVRAGVAPEWIQFRHAGRVHTVRVAGDGAFAVVVLGPAEEPQQVGFHGRALLARVLATDATWAADRGELLLRCPVVRARFLVARPARGGRLFAHIHPAGDAAFSTRRGREVPASADGRIPVPDLPDGLRGVLGERVGETRIVRGWFRVDAGGAADVPLAAKGRLVEVTMKGAQKQVSLVLRPPAWWDHPLPDWSTTRVVAGTRLQLWIPADATAVVVDGREVIPVERIRETLVLE